MTDSSTSAQIFDALPTPYESNIRLFFRHTLAITQKGICWRGRFMRFCDVISTRWGRTHHICNGLPTVTVCARHPGDKQKRRPMQIITRCKSVYHSLVNTSIILLNHLLVGLKTCVRYVVGAAMFDNESIYINHKKLFKDIRAHYYPWYQLALLCQQGTLIIEGDRGISKYLSYNENNNPHVIDYAINMALQHGLMRLSDMLSPAKQ